MNDLLDEEVCTVIAAQLGIDVKPDDVLRSVIPNSLSLVQALLALEDHFGVPVDYAQLEYRSTVSDLSGVIEKSAHMSVDAGAEAPPEATARIALNSMQVAYLLGCEPDLELGGQPTLVNAEASYPVAPRALFDAVTAVIRRHDILTHGVDLVSRSLVPGQAQPIVSWGEGDPSFEGCQQQRDRMYARVCSRDADAPLVVVHVQGNESSRLLVTFNMVVMDAGSLYLFLHEINEVLQGRALPDAVPISDAVARVEAYRTPERVENDTEYWARKCADLPPRPDHGVLIRGDRPWRTRRLQQVLDKSVVQKLTALCGREQTSMSALVLAAFTTVVARWDDVAALPINVTVSERVLVGNNAPVMGDFTSSMLVGVDVDSAASVLSLAKRIGEDLADGLAHRSVSGVEALALAPAPDDPTIARVPLVFTSYLGGSAGLDVTVDHVYSQTAQVCLDMQAMPLKGGEVALSWDVVDAYYPEADRMFTCALQLVDELADRDVILPLHDTAADERASTYNATDEPTPETTLTELVRQSVLQHPHREALCCRSLGITLTYGELWEQAGKIATALQQEGAGRGTAVVIEHTKNPYDAVAMLAAMRCGAAYVPVSASLPEMRKTAILESLEGSAVVITTQKATAIAASDTPAIAAVEKADPRDLAYVIFTSGTTGNPKGVKISHSGAVGTILDINKRYGVGPEDRIIGLSSFGFDLSVYDLMGSWAAGAAVSLVADERDADEIWDLLRHDRITLWNSAPAVMELALLRGDPGEQIDSVQQILLSGDRISADLPSRCMGVFPRATIHSLGGATEASIWSIQYPLKIDSLKRRIPYGYPLANQQMHVLSHDLVRSPIGVEGEIWIGGRGVALGYAGAPELTKAAFLEIPGLGRCYRTGDLGIFNHEGFIEFRGRRDGQVKVAGHRIELGEIETTLANSGLVRTSAAALALHQGRPELVCAYVGSSDSTPERVRACLRDHLPEYMIPARLVPVEELPLTAHGKLDVRSVMTRPHPDSEAPQSKDRGQFTGAVTRAFESLLETPARTGASFFELGGDSLRFQLLLRSLEQETGIRLRFRDVIAEPTVANISRLLAAGSPQSNSAPASAEPASVDDSAPFPLTEMQLAYYIGRHEGFELSGVGEHYYMESICDLDIARLEDALNQVIARHPMLRAVFTDDARQRILREVPRYRIAVDDLTNATSDEIERAVLKKRALLSHECFELDRWPLFSLSAIALPEGQYRLFLSLDMIIGDGASQQIFLNDLSRAYQGEDLPPTPGDFRSHVMSMRRRQEEAQKRPASAVTKRLLEKFPVGNVLPTKPVTTATMEVQRLSETLGAETVDALQRRARECGVSVSTVLLTAYATSLAMFSRNGTIGINITTYQRDHDLPGADEMIGDFTGIALVDLDDAEIIDDATLLRDIQMRVHEQLAEERSGVRLLSEIGRRRQAAGQALAPFVFTSLLNGKRSVTSGVLGEVCYALSQTPQVLLDHQVLQDGDRIRIAWDFASNVLPGDLIEAMFRYYLDAVRSFAAGQNLQQPLPLPSSRLLRNAWSAVRSPEAAAVSHAPAALLNADRDLMESISSWLRRDFGVDAQPQESLFDAGLDSLRFVDLVQRIQKRTGVRLPLADALANPTVEALASLARPSRLSEPVEGNSLVLLRDGDPRRVVVMLHGGFGSLEIYRDLALGMPKGVQVWGLTFDDHVSAEPRHLGVDEIIRHAVQLLSTQWLPETRIVAVGWSVGGTLAHALAAACSDRAAGLVLLDSLAPGPQVPVGDFSAAEGRRLLKAAGCAVSLTENSHELWTSAIEQQEQEGTQAQCARRLAAMISPTLVEDLGPSGPQLRLQDLSTLRTLIDARNAYHPGPNRIPALVVMPSDGEAGNARDWLKLVGPSRIVSVPGHHYSFVLGDDAGETVAATAAFVEEVLRRDN